jgi:hypothetical protein
MSARLAEIELRHIIASLERVRLNLAAGSSKKSVEKLIDDAKLKQAKLLLKDRVFRIDVVTKPGEFSLDDASRDTIDRLMNLGAAKLSRKPISIPSSKGSSRQKRPRSPLCTRSSPDNSRAAIRGVAVCHGDHRCGVRDQEPTDISQAGSGANFSVASSPSRTRLTAVAIVRVFSNSHVSSSFSPVRRTADGLARAFSMNSNRASSRASVGRACAGRDMPLAISSSFRYELRATLG